MKIAIVVPCYKVKSKILSVLASIPAEVERIYVVDDCCPEQSGRFIQQNASDSRIQVLFHRENQGVGGATISGYKAAINDEMDIIVKIDGDGQMDPNLIPSFISPIISQQFDYTKGNRFYRVDDVRQMPWIRLLGNASLSFFSKASTGYWHIFDPTNGYTAISTACLKNIDLDKVNKRYFFESDLLFRLAIVGANIKDVPMAAIYEDEQSNLKITKIIFPFIKGHLSNFSKRLVYDYFLRDFSFASIAFVLGISFFLFGTTFGTYHWLKAIADNTTATSGTVMLAALPIILGTQLFLSFLNYDISKTGTRQRATFLQGRQ